MLPSASGPACARHVQARASSSRVLTRSAPSRPRDTTRSTSPPSGDLESPLGPVHAAPRPRVLTRSVPTSPRDLEEPLGPRLHLQATSIRVYTPLRFYLRATSYASALPRRLTQLELTSPRGLEFSLAPRRPLHATSRPSSVPVKKPARDAEDSVNGCNEASSADAARATRVVSAADTHSL